MGAQNTNCTMKFIDIPEDRQREAINTIALQTGLPPSSIEKDWWVTQVLKALHTLPYAEHIAFKGGTSLSKCWNLIARFSEDVDIALSREFLGFSGELSKTQISDRLRRAACSFVRDKMLHDVRKALVDLGIRADAFSVDVVITSVTTTDPEVITITSNVAVMMFCENPSKFFPYTQIDVVTFPNGKMNDPNNFTEVTFKGSVPQMIKQTMDYIKSNVLKEHVRKISGRQEAERFWNYPYDAIEEAVVNSVYHRDFLQHEPIEITIEPSGISILNCPGPDRSISKEDIEKGDMLKSRRYRNRRLGDFLKELDLTEGRSTGVPTIQTKLAENGSPRAIFETTDDRLTFLVTIPVHEGCRESSETNSNSSETDILGSERGSETKTKSSERSSETKDLIIDIIKQDPHITAAEIAMQLNMSSRGVEKQIRKLRELGKIKRTGGRFGGYWEIVILDKE